MFNRFRFAVAGLLAAGLMTPALGQNTPTSKGAAPKAKSAGAANDPVLATVNNEPILKSEVAGILNRMTIQPGDEERLYDELMDTLVTSRLLSQFMASQRVTVTDQELKPTLERYEAEAKQNNTDLPTMLARNDVSYDEFKKRIAAALQWQKYVQGQATAAEIEKYFQKNKDLFNGATVRASHILVAVDPDASEADKAKAKEKLLAIKKEIDSGKISFANAANKYSEDEGNQETPSGGDLGEFLREGKYPEEISAAAFALKKGAVSEPVETKYGYHLIHVTDRREGDPVNLKQIEENVVLHYGYDLQKQIAKELRAKAKIDIKPMPAEFRLPAEPASPNAPAPKADSPSGPAAKKAAAPKP